MIKGERLRLRIERVDDEGSGVAAADARTGGRSVHIAYALPGEEVVAELEHLSPHRPDAWARLVEVAVPSPERAEPPCRAWGRCGGCALEHWDYGAQLGWKTERARAALGTIAAVDACVPSPRPLGYRDRTKLVFARGEAGVVLGGYAPRSHEVVDLRGCSVVEAPLDATTDALRDAAQASGLPIYDEATGEGVLRHALLRVNHAGQVLVLLVVARRAPGTAALGRALMAARPEVVGVVENLNPTRGNVLVGDVAEDVVLCGAEALEERVGPVRLVTSARAFLQVNRDVAARIYGDVAAAVALRAGERLVDVYCGVGGIALTCALGAPGAEVLGIEENATAVADAVASAVASGVPGARFVAGDARVLAEMAARGERADVVCVNPPRKGVDEAVLAACLALGARAMAYVSCNPATLARDLTRLQAGGYRVRRITPYDMLPHTAHIEALAVLERG